MTLQNNTNERLVRFLQAPPEVQALVDRIILEGKAPASFEQTTREPLLLGMKAGSKFLGVSRGTLWRMIKSGRLSKIEILPGSFRVRRSDRVSIAAGKTAAQ